jgi:hypothetical protein
MLMLRRLPRALGFEFLKLAPFMAFMVLTVVVDRWATPSRSWCLIGGCAFGVMWAALQTLVDERRDRKRG